MPSFGLPNGSNDLYFEKERLNMVEMRMDEMKMVGEGVGFERIRRITGYLVGTMNKWNNAKRSEEHDRVKHGCPKS